MSEEDHRDPRAAKKAPRGSFGYSFSNPSFQTTPLFLAAIVVVEHFMLTAMSDVDPARTTRTASETLVCGDGSE